MLKKQLTKWFLLSCLVGGSLSAAEKVGVVNFATCVAESKVGQEEQGNFDTIKQQLGSHLEKTEKELSDLASKLNDPDYMDGLSPEAERELKEKIHDHEEKLKEQDIRFVELSGDVKHIKDRIDNGLSQTVTEIRKKMDEFIPLVKESSEWAGRFKQAVYFVAIIAFGGGIVSLAFQLIAIITEKTLK